MFSVGDMVKVVGYQKDIDQMKELLGKTLVIQAVGKRRADHIWYLADGWNWRDDWLEPAYKRESIEELL